MSLLYLLPMLLLYTVSRPTDIHQSLILGRGTRPLRKDRNDLDGVLAEFDRCVGLDKLCALHLNDSKNPFASHKDRHEVLGGGSLGLETFRKIVNHPVLKDKPMILETPNELPGYAREIEILRSMAH